MTTIAALYLMERSAYGEIPGVDCWPASRDATRYPGPWPVVAHPPCGPWSAFWAHAAADDDKDLARLAVAQVRRWGGILEHPAHSRLWEERDLNLPPATTVEQLPLFPSKEFTVELDQARFGHPLRKRTWLLCVGVPRELIMMNLPPPRDPPPGPANRPLRYDSRRGTWYRRSMGDMFSPQVRKRTPAAFALWLVDLARAAESDEGARRCAGT